MQANAVYSRKKVIGIQVILFNKYSFTIYLENRKKERKWPLAGPLLPGIVKLSIEAAVQVAQGRVLLQKKNDLVLFLN